MSIEEVERAVGSPRLDAIRWGYLVPSRHPPSPAPPGEYYGLKGTFQDMRKTPAATQNWVYEVEGEPLVGPLKLLLDFDEHGILRRIHYGYIDSFIAP